MKAKVLIYCVVFSFSIVLLLILTPIASQASQFRARPNSRSLADQLTTTITESLSSDNAQLLPPERNPASRLPPTSSAGVPQPNSSDTLCASPFGTKTPTLADTSGVHRDLNCAEDLPLARALSLGPAASTAITTSFSEGFDDVTTLTSKGWVMQNKSVVLGTTNWFQGNSGVFPAHTGVITSYIAANFNNVSGAGTISNWLLTPEVQLKNGDRITFYTRAPVSSFPDRLEVRMSRAGAITDVGTSATSVGVFTTTLLTINPSLTVHGYPERWTMYSAVVSCLPAPVNGRIAFRYFVTDGGSGTNSDYIGIDTFNYASGATVLYDNGPLVNSPGAGFGGADASVLQTNLSMSTLGFGHAVSTGFRVAEDFTVTAPCGWDIESFTLFGYQTGSALTSTFSAVNYRIWDGVPGAVGSNVVFGTTTTNRLIGSMFSNIYRVQDTTLTNSTRPVMSNTVAAGFHLAPGIYWIDWQSGGTLSSGPWAPPISVSGTITTGNALQFNPTASTWGPLLDTGTNTQQGLPFVINRVVQWRVYLPLILR